MKGVKSTVFRECLGTAKSSLINEMYIHEDLVNDKNTGKLIGFTSFGSVSDQLIALQRKAEGDHNQPNLAKTTFYG